MSGTKAGGLKTRETIRKRYGDDWYVKIGKMGGSVSSPNKGFGSNHERAVTAGRKGGTISKRGKAKKETKCQTQ